MPSGKRALASRRPVSSWISTSWWSSAQSSPTNSNVTSSNSLDSPVSSLQENPRPNGQVLTPTRGGHDIPSAVRLPDHRWRHDLGLGLEVQVGKSAHPSAATRHRACHVCRSGSPH